MRPTKSHRSEINCVNFDWVVIIGNTVITMSNQTNYFTWLFPNRHPSQKDNDQRGKERRTRNKQKPNLQRKLFNLSLLANFFIIFLGIDYLFTFVKEHISWHFFVNYIRPISTLNIYNPKYVIDYLYQIYAYVQTKEL